VLHLEIVRLDPELALPSYARDGDAGLDLYARHDTVVGRAGGRAVVETGIAVAIPQGYAGLVLPRSGLALRHGITLVNTPGLIDSGYRGEIKVVLLNTDPHDSYQVHRGDRVAQLVVQQVEQVSWTVVESFDGEHRGGGFGHSGR
jgi:dUTP pyrophosphatase